MSPALSCLASSLLACCKERYLRVTLLPKVLSPQVSVAPSRTVSGESWKHEPIRGPSLSYSRPKLPTNVFCTYYIPPYRHLTLVFFPFLPLNCLSSYYPSTLFSRAGKTIYVLLCALAVHISIKIYMTTDLSFGAVSPRGSGPLFATSSTSDFDHSLLADRPVSRSII